MIKILVLVGTLIYSHLVFSKSITTPEVKRTIKNLENLANQSDLKIMVRFGCHVNFGGGKCGNSQKYYFPISSTNTFKIPKLKYSYSSGFSHKATVHVALMNGDTELYIYRTFWWKGREEFKSKVSNITLIEPLSFNIKTNLKSRKSLNSWKDTFKDPKGFRTQLIIHGVKNSGVCPYSKVENQLKSTLVFNISQCFIKGIYRRDLPMNLRFFVKNESSDFYKVLTRTIKINSETTIQQAFEIDDVKIDSGRRILSKLQNWNVDFQLNFNRMLSKFPELGNATNLLISKYAMEIACDQQGNLEVDYRLVKRDLMDNISDHPYSFSNKIVGGCSLDKGKFKIIGMPIFTNLDKVNPAVLVDVVVDIYNIKNSRTFKANLSLNSDGTNLGRLFQAMTRFE